MKSWAALTFCLALGVCYGPDLLAQPLSSEEVSGPIHADFKPSADQCVAGKTVPALVKIEILIQKDGSASWVSSSPALDPAVEACLKAAMEKVKFRASGQAFKAVYSFKPGLEEAAPAAPPAAPAPAAPAPVPAAQPVQPAAPVPPVPPAPPVSVAAPEETVPAPAVDQDLYRRVRISRGLMIGGFAAFGAMWISMMITSAVLWVDEICISADGGDSCPDTAGHYVNVGALAPLIGPFWSAKDLLDAGYRGAGAWYIINPLLQIALLTVGIAGLASMVTSYRRMNQKQSVYKVMFLPLVTRSPGEGQVVGGMLAGYF